MNFFKNKPVTGGMLLFFILGLLLNFLFNLPAGEGFNPSDDGVILAQAFRIWSGEIPHVDFISSKPVFSGILHSSYFGLPFPLMESARWFVVIEQMITALFFTLLIFRVFRQFFSINATSVFQFSGLALFIFFMNRGTMASFPWTTIDALMFASAGSFFLLSYVFNSSHTPNSGNWHLFVGMTLLSLAVICRQSFVLFPPIILIIIVLSGNILTSRNWIFIVSGAFPIVLYAFIFMISGNLGSLIMQLAGRNELFETAVLRPLKSFAKSPWAIVNSLFFIGLLIFLLNKKHGSALHKLKIAGRLKVVRHLREAHTIISIISVVGGAFAWFLWIDPMFLTQPWAFFIILFFQFLFGFVGLNWSKNEILLSSVILFLAWVTSISLGLNSPAIFVGVLAGMSLFFSFRLINSFLRLSVYVVSGFLFLFLSAAIFGQKKFNYRDLPAWELDHNLGELFPQGGKVKCSKQIFDYYSDFIRVRNLLPDFENHFVMVPNNAAIYPLTSSRNPFPVDWMQHDEYLGAEKLLYEKMEHCLTNGPLYLFVDKYNTDEIAYSLNLMDYDENPSSMKNDVFVKKFGVKKYDYLAFLLPRMTRLMVESEYFIVYYSGSSTTNASNKCLTHTNIHVHR